MTDNSQQLLDDRGRARGMMSDIATENGRLPSPLFKHYDNIFRSYYHFPANLDEGNIHKLVADIIGLLDVAESLGSLKVITLNVDNALIKQGQVLYRSISANAAVWASLAMRLHSEVIMREAIIHMVGQWTKMKSSPHIDDEVRTLCETKWQALTADKMSAERLILGHYPSHLQRPTEPNVGPGGATVLYKGSTRTDAYAAQVVAWMAMNLYRHWVGQHICTDAARYAADEGYAFYNAVATGGDAYLAGQAVEDFAQFFPLSSKARRAFDEQMGLMKEGVKPYVEALVKNNSSLDTKSFAIAHLTCAKVEKSEMPWRVVEDAAGVQGSARRKRRADTPLESDEESEVEERPKKRTKERTALFKKGTDGDDLGTGLPWEESEEEAGEESDEGDADEEDEDGTDEA